MNAELIRVYQPEQTPGFLVVRKLDDILFTCVTLELPNLGNRRNISCIPEGKYEVVKRGPLDHRPYVHFHIQDVPGRSYILLHPGNYNWHVKGCILPGKYHDDLNDDGLLDVAHSTDTLSKLVDVLPDQFTLKIRS